jgi:hypothetical protein
MDVYRGVLFLSISFLIGREWDVVVWEVEGGFRREDWGVVLACG